MPNHTSVEQQHPQHWETSVWPLVLGAGVLFVLPLAFAFNFVYHQPLLAVLCVGIGVPLTIAAIAGWVNEAIGGGEGLSAPAMGWFILAEAMIFLSLFTSYWYMRLSALDWPPAGTPPLPVVVPLVMTAALVSSSVTIHLGEVALHRGDRARFLGWLLATIALGGAFIGMSVYEWADLLRQGFNFEINSYGTAFYSITGFHGAHVAVGLGIFAAILLPALVGRTNQGFVKTAGIYWHFVDIIWLFVVSQVYYW